MYVQSVFLIWSMFKNVSIPYVFTTPSTYKCSRASLHFSVFWSIELQTIVDAIVLFKIWKFRLLFNYRASKAIIISSWITCFTQFSFFFWPHVFTSNTPYTIVFISLWQCTVVRSAYNVPYPAVVQCTNSPSILPPPRTSLIVLHLFSLTNSCQYCEFICAWLSSTTEWCWTIEYYSFSTVLKVILLL